MCQRYASTFPQAIALPLIIRGFKYLHKSVDFWFSFYVVRLHGNIPFKSSPSRESLSLSRRLIRLSSTVRFILMLRIICSLRLFDSSTSPLSKTRFIAGHSPNAYRIAYFIISPPIIHADLAHRSSTTVLTETSQRQWIIDACTFLIHFASFFSWKAKLSNTFHYIMRISGRVLW